MHVLVTGGAGYLGSLIVPELLRRGHRVTVYDSFLWGFQSLLHIAGNPELRVVKGDVRDISRLRPVIRENDAVINLAAIVGFPACAEKPIDATTTNLDAVAALSKEISRSQILIQASTGSTYGKVDGICSEETPINPLSLYGSTKAQAENYVRDVDGICLRFATVFGVSPRLRLDLLVNDIVYQVIHYNSFLMYEGHSRRTFIHSTDAARSILFAIEHADAMRGRPFNVGDDSLNYSKRDVALMVKGQHDYFLYSAEIGEDKDKRDYEVSYARLRGLGFQCEVSMESGISELLRVMPYVQEHSVMRNI